MYYVTVNGKRYRFKTLDKARKVASDVFEKTGVILGIEKASSSFDIQG